MTKKEFINYVKEIRELHKRASDLTYLLFKSLNENKNNDFGLSSEDMWEIYQGVNPSYDFKYEEEEDND